MPVRDDVIKLVKHIQKYFPGMGRPDGILHINPVSIFL